MKSISKSFFKLATVAVFFGMSFSSLASTQNDSAASSRPSFLAPLPQVPQAVKQAIIDNSDQLAFDPQSPTIGRADAPVTVVEFFDYQCMYCHKAFPLYEEYVKTHPNIRFVFKEFPFFGPVSRYAALVSLDAYKTGGQKLFAKYHNAQFTAKNSEGKGYTDMLRTDKLTIEKVNDIAKSVGIEVKSKSDLEKYAGEIKRNFKLASKISVRGTPTFIVLPTPLSGKQIKTDQISLIPGAVPMAYINQAVAKAKQ
ncbi:thioredoxin domain-containing protein [Vibrio sp. S4M6]|uniref:thioredoxin domain-containing protein n=1 Tax=Vibrio sinus TaxID=2946865 RepID=UPI002029C919|nr:thioredoxin domain-containing protein [Vibrio sinus]MCL9781652.1 thioredoxin domain-containing protein [Vibrio sinus]